MSLTGGWTAREEEDEPLGDDDDDDEDKDKVCVSIQSSVLRGGHSI
jgi:hypothetical protein